MDELELKKQELNRVLISLNQAQGDLEVITNASNEAQEALDSINSQLEAVNIEYNAKIEKFNIEIKNIGFSIDEASKEASLHRDQLSADLDKFITDIEAKKTLAITSYKETISNLKLEAETLLNDIQSKSSEIIQININLNTLKSSETAISDEIASKTNELNNLNDQIVTVKSSLASLTVESIEKTKIVNSIIVELENLSSKVIESNHTIEKNAVTISDQAKTIEEGTLIITNLQNEITELEVSKDKYVKEKMALADERSTLNQREAFIQNKYKVAGIPYN